MRTAEPLVGILGASSLVGECLQQVLLRSGRRILGFSRRIEKINTEIEWQCLSTYRPTKEISHWICLAPIWALAEHFALIEASGARRIVVLSSTSRFTKTCSDDPTEIATAEKLAEGEKRLQTWAESRGIEWVILRPTLIYGLGRDKNICEIARLVRRLGFFPVFGQARGLRQPIHAQDVATACAAALQTRQIANCAYNISGGETLSYREMVSRIFAALGRRPRLLTVPLWIFRLAVFVLRAFPRYRQWSTAMAERMNRDLVFDHTQATHDLGFKPRHFVLAAEDLTLTRNNCP